MNTFRIFYAVMADETITPSGKSVFLNLLSRTDGKGYCYPAVATIEKETGYCERTIQRQTKSLEEKGYLVKIEQKHMKKQFTNRYYIVPEEEEVFFIKDADVRDFIYEDSDFQDFLEREEVIVQVPYKLHCIRMVYRSLKISKEAKLLLSYLIYRADRETFTYSTIQRLQQTVCLPMRKVKKAFHELEQKRFITDMKKHMDTGEIIFLAKINLGKFGLHKFVKSKKKIKHTYTMWIVRAWMLEEAAKFKRQMKNRELCCRQSRLLIIMILRQSLEKHVLFWPGCCVFFSYHVTLSKL